ncbi:MAG: hypothetical protein DRN15_03245 [Thermoprotei archaeon]|nr:MAG: hypothetical protein DRM97_07980 [Thermoprotei archaeon]RLF24414.1 MAG: hypothetical protein DRN15_03245 [Thermoprotei archaeon]
MTQEEIHKVHEYIEAHFNEHLELTRRLLQQPSISATGEGIEECAQMVADHLKELGATVQLVRFRDGHPIVYGKLYSKEAKKTIIAYSMYDVQPPEPLDEWIAPPFEARIVQMEPFGDVIVARGAINTKGPLMAFINAVKSIMDSGLEPPVNMIFLIEGEEEIGSPHVPVIVKEKLDELKKADAVYFPSATQDERGVPSVVLGCKGIVYVELEVRGGSWGGPKERDIHSSYIACVDSPVWRLIHLLSTLCSPEGKVLIDGFYDNVAPPSPDDMEMLKKTLEVFDEEVIKRRFTVERFRGDAKGLELLKNLIFSPALNIDGIYAGYIGPGTKTVLPYRAMAKLDFRLVPNMTPEEVVEKLKKHLKKHGFSDVKLKVRDAYPWAKTDPRASIVRAAIRALNIHGFDKYEVWPMSPGSAPFYAFASPPLSLPFVMAGLGHGSRAHAPNEYITVKGLKDLEKYIVTFIYEYASLK